MSKPFSKVGIVAGVVVVAGLSVWYLLAHGKASPVVNTTEAVETENAGGGSNDVYQIGKTPADVFGGILAASIPDSDLNLPDKSLRDSFHTDAQAWLQAYAADDSAPIIRLMQDAGISLPLTWTDEQHATKDFREYMSGLTRVRFDPGATRVTTEPLESLSHPFHEHPSRTYTRDPARPFLKPPDARLHLLRREALFPGTVRDAAGNDVSVTLGIEFALDPKTKRWVPIRTAVYDFPNEVEGNGPIL